MPETLTHEHAPVISPIEAIGEQTKHQPYPQHWEGVANFYQGFGEPEASRQATFNGHNLNKLDELLIKPKYVHLGYEPIAADEVAQEWYLRLGSLNQLQGAGSKLVLGFIRMMESARGMGPTKDIENGLRGAISAIPMEPGIISETLRNIAGKPKSANKAILAGNALLDFVRSVPYTERTKSHKTYLNVSRRLNEGLLDYVLQKEPDDEDDRVVSDTLKFKYESAFELLLTSWKDGTISEEQYQQGFNRTLHRQLAETRKLAMDNWLSNGDLHEHYFSALARYSLTSWRDQKNLVVQCATRRQDSPHDNFVPQGLLALSFDAMIIDVSGNTRDQFIQLKLPGLVEKYEDGITLVDDLVADVDNVEIRDDILVGMEQLQGLVMELCMDKTYNGGTAEVSRHLQALENDLLPVQR